MVHGAVRRGGSVGLVELIDRYGEAIDADLAQHYPGVNILDFFRGTLPPGRVFRLLQMLPDTSRLAAQILADPTHKSTGSPELWRDLYGWGRDRHMQADLWDVISASIPREKGKKAESYPRPGAKPVGVPMSRILPVRRRPVKG